MGSFAVIVLCFFVLILCLLYFVVLASAQIWIWIRTARDGERPRWTTDASAAVACTPREAFALVGDPRNDVRLSPRVIAVEFDTPGGPHEGATYREIMRLGPTTAVVPCTITAYDPPRKIETSATYARRAIVGGTLVEAHSDGCVLTSYAGGVWTATMIASGGLTLLLARRECRRGLAQIRAILEGR